MKQNTNLVNLKLEIYLVGRSTQKKKIQFYNQGVSYSQKYFQWTWGVF